MELNIREPDAIRPCRPVWYFTAAWILAVCFSLRYFSFVAADPDLWGHIRFGEQIWRLGSLEHVDPYAFTTHGMTWINHEWLVELLFFGVYRAAGDAGLLVLKLLTGVFVVIIIGRICCYRRQTPVVFVAFALPAIISIAPGFMIRPQLATYLLFAFYLLILHLFFNRRQNWLWGLPLLMAAWVNLHGGFLMGIALLGVVAAWQAAVWLFTKSAAPQLKQLGVAFIATVLATLANPYGYKLHLFLYHSLKIERAISEWEPVNLLDGTYPAFKLLVIALGVTVLILRRKAFGWEAAGLVFLLYAAVRHQRHIPFFAMMAWPYLVYQASCGVAGLQARYPGIKFSRPATMIIAAAFFLIGGHQAMAGIGNYRQSGWRITVNTNVYPVAAVRFMQKNGIGGNLLLPFEWGEYAIWKLYPACRVSIDGRFRTTYPEAVIADHFKARRNGQLILETADKYAADILLTHQSPATHAIIQARHPAWLYVYSDPVAAVYLRNSARNQALLAVFRQGAFVYPKDAPSPFFP